MFSKITNKILVVGPLPPPQTGNSLPIQILIKSWEKQGYKISSINLNRSGLLSGTFSFERLFLWLKIYFHVFFNKGKYHFIYLSLAESTFGNLRDLLFYAILGKKRNVLIVHLFGGYSFKKIIQSNGIIGRLNRYYLGGVLKIVVESEYQKTFFSSLSQSDKVQIIENFAEDDLFTTEGAILQKFHQVTKLRIIFLSNLLYGKGHLELLDAFLLLKNETREKFELHFVGNLVHDPEKNFLNKIVGTSDIFFHGFLNGDKKRDLLFNCHIFCLPTYYPYEGLPFSIIESYASGCVGIMTAHSGIPFIFEDKKNGFQIQKQDIYSIVEVLENIAIKAQNGHEFLKEKALFNYKQALKRNRASHFVDSFNNILD
jgi:glycosyltransferase involved in cell wall biosynthesis